MDWMHVLFVGGVFNVHVGHMMHAIKEEAITAPFIENFVRQFNFPSGHTEPSDVFSTKRFSSSWKEWTLKATASECLSLVPCLAVLFQGLLDTLLPDRVRLRAHVAGFMLLVRVVDLLLATSRLSTC